MNHLPGGFELVYADADLLVLDKPTGLLCVPGRGGDKQDCLSTRVQAVYPDARIVHRLDMATSGLVLMARGSDNQRRLSAAFEDRQVGKRYVAWVAGAVDTTEVETDGWSNISLPIATDWPNRPRQTIDLVRGKPSMTRWRPLPFTKPASNISCSKLELEPITGRTHQLRVHLAAIGHPILGDALYAGDSINLGVDRLMLHAVSLHMPHPQSHIDMHFESTAPF